MRDDLRQQQSKTTDFPIRSLWRYRRDEFILTNCFQADDISSGSHNVIDSNNDDDDDDDDGEAADMEEFEESGMLEMVDPVSQLIN